MGSVYDDYEKHLEDIERYNLEFLGRYPYCCRKCRAYGFEVWDEYGDLFVEECNECVREGKCPRCGEYSVKNSLEDDLLDLYEKIENFWCINCGWVGGQEGLIRVHF